jgi:ankyrin repeat protein
VNSDDREFVSVRITNSVTRNISDATVSVEDRGRLPLLYSLSRNWAWEAINFRCRTHPEEASADLIDARGDNILHWCAFGHPPINTIETILAVSPQLAAVKNKQGQTPLHGTVLCRFGGTWILILSLSLVHFA